MRHPFDYVVCILLASIVVAFLWGSLILLMSVISPAEGATPLAREAQKWRATVTREVRFWWGLDEPRGTFAAQIHQESRWDATARSPVGAAGLTQFMPGTATWIAQLYPRDLQPADVYDPKWAIRACVKYDRWIWQRFPSARDRQERWGFTLASYNAGLGHIRKEARQAPEPDVWFGSTEQVCTRRVSACRESQTYVQRIWFRWRPLYAHW
jgi:soluble lytic murein transglycosylase-like protein